jgi:hypothetical protein
MSNIKTFKKGEYLFKEGDKITSVFFIQSGSVQGVAIRKKTLEIFTIGANQILGELGLINGTSHNYSALCAAETKALELPVEALKTQIEAQSTLKIVIKSLAERLKSALFELKGKKLESDASPCPEDQVPKIFASVFHTLNHKGEKDGAKVHIEWGLFKQYVQRIFGESPKRAEQVINILVKLKYASLEMGKSVDNPEGPEEIQGINIDNLSVLEIFFEFYQYYYFKALKPEVLKVDESCHQILKNLLICADGVPLDRLGIVSLDFPKVVERFKTEFGINLNNDHFTRLEQKGVFAKRASRTDGQMVIQFELREYNNIVLIWKILREIDKWNEKGFVDPFEQEIVIKKKAGLTCPSCSAPYVEQQKFCGECGSKLS